MKQFALKHGYRGRYFDIRFCAKSRKHAAEILGTNTYYIKQTAYVNPIEVPYEGIKAKAYSHTAKSCIGHENEMDFEEAKRLIDVACDAGVDNYNLIRVEKNPTGRCDFRSRDHHKIQLSLKEKP